LHLFDQMLTNSNEFKTSNNKQDFFANLLIIKNVFYSKKAYKIAKKGFEVEITFVVL